MENKESLQIGNQKKIFTVYSVYDVRPIFISSGFKPFQCPVCRNEVVNTPIDFSQGAIKWMSLGCIIHALPSILSKCDNCNWWCVQEGWEECEYHIPPFMYYIVANHIGTEKETVSNQTPWEKALNDPNIYDHFDELPKEFRAD
jgi:hypothetical protein